MTSTFTDYLTPEEQSIWARINELDPQTALEADLMLRRAAESRGWIVNPLLLEQPA